MANPKYMQAKSNGTVVPFDADLFKTEKYVPYDPDEQVPPKAEKPGKPARAGQPQD